MRSPKFDQIIDEIKALGFEKGATFVNPKTGKTVVRHVDFNQGLDAFLLNEHKAQRLGELAIKPARIAFDHIEDEDVYVRAITLCARAGIDHMSNYLLYNGEDFTGIVETILSSKPGYKVIAGILENFGEKVCTDLLKKIDLFSGHDNDKLTMLIKANKSKRLVDFDFSLLQFIPYFHVSNLLSKQEEQIIMNSAYELKEAPIRKILLLHLDELKDVLIKTNGAQPGDTQIISVIEEQIKELYHQISIFEL